MNCNRNALTIRFARTIQESHCAACQVSRDLSPKRLFFGYDCPNPFLQCDCNLDDKLPPSLSPEALKTLTRLRDEFQQQWHDLNQPKISDFTDQVDSSLRRSLFANLIVLDLKYRRADDQQPRPDDYVADFPEFAHEIDEAFFDQEFLGTRAPETRELERDAPSPAKGTNDRNLLFGILAHQMDFVGSNALIKAMNAWAIEKTRSLADILIEHGEIKQDTSDLLTALVAEHVRQHGNARESLASLRGSVLHHTDLEMIGDGDIRASLSQLSGDERERIVANTQFEAYQADARYRIIRPHARGGIGEVFVAEDQELSREVALKELQCDQSFNEDCLARFLLEAEVTGQLEHPGIVPVYGLGHYADGRPFYAMRFIQGESLQSAIGNYHRNSEDRSSSDQRLELYKLLGSFVDVCHAMEYAHSRGVLHRDLKPANVMLGDYGETLVVDWGLARSGNRDDGPVPRVGPALKLSSMSGSAPTRMGSVFGTPAYMPPEQAAGDLDRIGPCSDVYSLGATLYELLTGQPPFLEHELGDLLSKIQAGEFPRSIAIKSDVPRALDAICSKAMSANVEDRYASPMALANDVQHWLADEPVSAWQEPWSYRLRRWTRSHKTLVTSSAVAAVVGLACLSVGLVLINDSRRREANARKEAQENYVVAEGHFRKARSAVDQFYTQVSEELLFDEPGMQPVRRELLSQALTYYETFLEQRADDPTLEIDVARTWYRIGAIRESLHSPEDAIAAYANAQEMQDRILQLDPENRGGARRTERHDQRNWSCPTSNAVLRQSGRRLHQCVDASPGKRKSGTWKYGIPTKTCQQHDERGDR